MDALPFCHLPVATRKPLSEAYPKEVRTLGDRIRKKRLDLGLRQRDVATQIGCDKTTVANWEKNRSEPRIIHLAGVWIATAPDILAKVKRARKSLLTH